jgi:hypothetical protein
MATGTGAIKEYHFEVWPDGRIEMGCSLLHVSKYKHHFDT